MRSLLRYRSSSSALNSSSVIASSCEVDSSRGKTRRSCVKSKRALNMIASLRFSDANGASSMMQRRVFLRRSFFERKKVEEEKEEKEGVKCRRDSRARSRPLSRVLRVFRLSFLQLRILLSTCILTVRCLCSLPSRYILFSTVTCYVRVHISVPREFLSIVCISTFQGVLSHSFLSCSTCY